MAKAAAQVAELHAAVKRGDLAAIKALLEKNPALADARSETDARGTFPLHVAAQSGQAAAAKLLLDYGADVSSLDLENDAIALGWAAFFGRPEVVAEVLRRDDRRLAQGGRPHPRARRSGVKVSLPAALSRS